MDAARNERLAKALLQFKLCYKELVEASVDIPDFDISEAYPFYLLDFEKIEPAIEQWCTVNATKILKLIPHEVTSPLDTKRHAQPISDEEMEKELDKVAEFMMGRVYRDYATFEDAVAEKVEELCPGTAAALSEVTIGITVIWGHIRNYIRAHSDVSLVGE